MDQIQSKRSALVVEGGAMRVVFANGVLDTFIQEDFYPFDLHIGVSAGASSIAGYLARMYKRNYLLLTRFCTKLPFINWKNWLMGKHWVDLDWFFDVAMRDLHLDHETLFAADHEFLIGMTHMECGRCHFIRADSSTLEEHLLATGALPFLYRKWVKVNGMTMVDGSISDSIPVRAALERQANTIMVIRSRPRAYRMETPVETRLAAFRLNKKYPALSRTLLSRADYYNQSIELLRQPPEGVDILEITPPEQFKTARFSTDFDALQRDYQAGREAGYRAIEQWRALQRASSDGRPAEKEAQRSL